MLTVSVHDISYLSCVDVLVNVGEKATFQIMTDHRVKRLKWHVQLFEQLARRVDWFPVLIFTYLTLFSMLCFTLTSLDWLFSLLPHCCVCFGKSLYTHRTVCLNLGWTRFTLLSCRFNGGVILPLYESQQQDCNSSLRAALYRSLLLFKGVRAPFQMHPRDHHTLSVHTKSPGGLACGRGVW